MSERDLLVRDGAPHQLSEAGRGLGHVAPGLVRRTQDNLERRSPGTAYGRRGWLIRRLLLFADIVGLALAFAIAQLAFGRSGGRVEDGIEYLLFLGTLPVWIIAAKLYGLYDNDEERTDHATTDEVITLFHFITVGTWILFSATWITHIAAPAPVKLASFWVAAIVLVGIGRSVARAAARRTSAYLQNTVIVGVGRVEQLIARKLLKHPEYGINLLGFLGERSPSGDLGRFRILDSPRNIRSVVESLDVERVIVAFPDQDAEETLELVRELQGMDVQVDVVPRLYEVVGPGVSMHAVEGLPMIGLPPFRLARSSALLKRLLDLGTAALGLVLLAPLFAVIAVAIKLDSRGPVFFRQTRRGVRSELFRLFKFRTMVADAELRKAEVAHLNKHVAEGGDPRMFKIEHDPRVTRVGRLLRRYMLDELPQLINVLVGTMSLVGPRPLILEEDQYVDGWARKRLELKPGMTGLWQVLGRQAISFDEMVKLDYVYVTTWSLGNDFRLLLRTLPLVLKGEGGSY